MMSDIPSMIEKLKGAVEITGAGVEVKDEDRLADELIEELIYTAVLHDDDKVKTAARWIIREAAAAMDTVPASIHEFYMARGRGEYGGFSVPAINIRTLTYDTARAIMRAAQQNNSTSVIFEIAKSEMGYTQQPPAEYAPCIIAAAVRERYKAPVFIQADHTQLKLKNFKADRAAEVEANKKVISDAMAAGYYNIDIDSSTLVDLSKPTVDEQQRDNYEAAAELTKFIRENEPEGVTVSVGGEIGEVGDKNSTEEELVAYMEGYRKLLPKGMAGISKVSIQTGTTHGGIPTADGSIAEVQLDFDTLNRLSDLAQRRYAMGGAVQHGASTLPDELFDKFPQHNCLEIHLATGFQNILCSSKHFPKDLLEKLYRHLDDNHSNERKEGWTDEQFYYKLRKKVWGPFKSEVWGLPRPTIDALMAELETQFDFLFKKLNAINTKDIVARTVPLVRVPVPKPF
ncbi:MAG: class II fructose-bisphosphate aldolase [bacterium]